MAVLPPVHVPRVALHSTVLVGCLALLAYQLRHVDFATIFDGLSPAWATAAIGAFLVSLAAAAHNISAFAPVRLRAVDTMRAQLAIGGLRVMAPSAVSTPAIGSRFLTRQGLPMPTAVTVLAVAQTAQLLMTIVVVSGIALLGSRDLPTPSSTELLIGAGVVAALVVAGLVARTLPAGRRAVAAAVSSVKAVGANLREQPLRVVTGLAASGLLTLAHITTFVCCVHAVGGHASVLALTAVYLAASTAGSLVPTPGGVGAVESTMISGLIACGSTPQLATAAALVSRLVTVWLPAVPGLWALRSLRRDGMV